MKFIMCICKGAYGMDRKGENVEWKTKQLIRLDEQFMAGRHYKKLK